MEGHSKDLNPEQRKAVEHDSGPLLVFAGAGSGKTRVLTRRIAHLVLRRGVSIHRIAAVTFTNKAAAEMKGRVAELLQRGTRAMWVSTFHSMCCRLLREHASLLNYKDSFAIYDSDDSMAVMKRVFERLKVDSRLVEPRAVLTKIDRAKNNFLFPEDLRDDRSLPYELAQLYSDIFAEYQKELLSCNAMDFGDLLTNVVTLFQLEPEVLHRYQDQFEHLMIDEYQDTNRVQYMLVEMLAKKHRNICVVGDDDQSIYAFRGATIENILRFKKDFPDATVVTLDTNYRSTGNILSAANAVIAENRRRQEKSMKTPNPTGAPITLVTAFDEKEEASIVAQEIVSLRQQGVPFHEMAIFYRTNAQSRAIEEALNSSRIPYEIYGAVKFYERKEIKDILAYLRLIINPADNEAFLRVINVPARGVGNTTVGKLKAYALQARLPLLPALQQALTENVPFLKGKTRDSLLSFVRMLEVLETERIVVDETLAEPSNFQEKRSIVPQFFKSIADHSGYLNALKQQNTPEAEGRIENIYELFEVAGEVFSQLITTKDSVAVRDFLEHTSLATDLDKQAAVDEKGNLISDTVSLMTLHLAKGLEFDVVFLTGVEEGLLPHVRSLDSRDDLEEERRLCYVGMTRARRLLYLSYAEHRQSFIRGGYYSGDPSRFIFSIPESAIAHRLANREESDQWMRSR